MSSPAVSGHIDALLHAPDLRPMRFDDYEDIRTLLQEYALEPPSFEDWRHRWVDNPIWWQLGKDSPIGWVLETAKHEIVGSMETIPIRYKWRGSDLVAGASAAWCVKAPYRGYALQLIEEYFEQPVDLLISTTVGRAAFPTLSQLYGPIPLGRWDMMSYFITGYLSFAERALKKYRVPLAPLLAYPAAGSLRLKHALSSKTLPKSERSLVVERTDTFDARFDTFWEELVRENYDKLLAERSSRALMWHFEGAIRRNRLLIFTASNSGRLRGYCVLRRQPTAGGCRMSVVDYQSLELGADLLPSFLRAALRCCAAEGCYVLQNVGVGVPKMRAFDQCAPYRQKLPNSIFFYRAANAKLDAELRQPQFWDPSLFDGDATL